MDYLSLPLLYLPPVICIPPSTRIKLVALSQQRRRQASMVQQYPVNKNPLFVHKAFTKGPAPVLIVPTVYLLGYFGPGAGPLKALCSLVVQAAFL